MEKEMKKLIDKYLEGETTIEEEKAIREYFARKDIPEEYSDMRDIFEMMASFENTGTELEDDALSANLEQVDLDKKPRVISLQYKYSIAAAIALLVVGFGIGWLIGGLGKIDGSQVAALRDDIHDMKEAMMVSKLHKESVSGRIQAAYEISESVDSADDKILDALIYSLNTDANSNVRMAAAEALFKYSQSDKVRDAFINSLNTQKDPLVKIKIIDMLVSLGEKRALPELQKVMKDEQQLKMVKDRAAQGISRLI